ncbi:beta-alanine transporter-like [Dermacentor albipictus]|uniref:beta-alanine transporter-like n=1 Tax=Dermacentor albipictus TaxID=60249 RepID=UPI0038FCDA54
MLFEEALQLVGEFGVFQWLLIVYLVVFVAPMRVIPLFAHIFTLLEPPHWCRQPELEDLFNLTREEARELGVPRESDGSWSKCSMYELNLTTLDPWMVGQNLNRSLHARDLLPVVPCQFGWHYDHSVIYPTIVSEMNWVCGQTWKAYISNSIFFGAMSIGVIGIGAISDKIGRVPVMIAIYILAGVSAVTTYFTQDFYLFLVTRIVQGGVILSISIIPFVLALEYVPAQKRMLVLSAFRFAYPVLGVCMPWVAYALAHWRLLNAIVVLPCLVGPVVSIFIPESTRWLLSKGRTDRAKKILLSVARVNGKQVEGSALDSLQLPNKTDASKRSSTTDVFRYPTLRRSFLITLFLWLMSCLTYSAGQLYAATATDDPFVMTSTTNAMDILATVLALPLADRWGRRPSMVCAYGLAALCYLGVAGFYGKSAAIFAIMMVGRFALTTAYNVGYLFAAEIYPTEIRSQALSIRQAFGSLGKFLSAQVVQLAFYGRFLPLFVLGGLSCASALITLPLPETNNQRLPETLQEGEAMRELPKPWFPCLAEKKRERSGTATRGRSMSTMSAATIDSVSPH